MSVHKVVYKKFNHIATLAHANITNECLSIIGISYHISEVSEFYGIILKFNFNCFTFNCSELPQDLLDQQCLLMDKSILSYRLIHVL